MARGRPKGSKNKIPAKTTSLFESPVVTTNTKVETTKVETKTTNSTEPVVEKTIKRYTYTCEICNKTFEGSPTRINFMQLTGKAEYHRDAKSDKLNICNACSAELSDVVDRWLIKKNPNLLRFGAVSIK